MHGADADTEFIGDLLDAFSLASRGADPVLYDLGSPRSAQRLALCSGPFQTCFDPLPDHDALELGKHAAHLKHGLASEGRGIDPLLVEIKIDVLGMEVRLQGNELL